MFAIRFNQLICQNRNDKQHIHNQHNSFSNFRCNKQHILVLPRIQRRKITIFRCVSLLCGFVAYFKIDIFDLMNFITDHIYSIYRSFTMIIQGKYLLYFLPGMLLAIGYFYYIQSLNSVNDYLGIVGYVPYIGESLQTGVSVFFGWIEGLSLFIFQFILITLLSPFHTVLSERIDREETGSNFENSWSKIINDLVRTIGVAILGGLMYLFIKLIWLMIAYILGIGFLTPYMTIVFISFFTGFNSYDFSLERYDYSVAQSWGYAFKHPLHMISTGLIFTGFLAIPHIGIVLAPVFLTMVGTLSFLKIRNREVVS